MKRFFHGPYFYGGNYPDTIAGLDLGEKSFVLDVLSYFCGKTGIVSDERFVCDE